MRHEPCRPCNRDRHGGHREPRHRRRLEHGHQRDGDQVERQAGQSHAPEQPCATPAAARLRRQLSSRASARSRQPHAGATSHPYQAASALPSPAGCRASRRTTAGIQHPGPPPARAPVRSPRPLPARSARGRDDRSRGPIRYRTAPLIARSTDGAATTTSRYARSADDGEDRRRTAGSAGTASSPSSITVRMAMFPPDIAMT